MPEVIADTSVVLYLHQTGLLDLLRELYGSVTVPRAVVDELAAGRAQGIDLPDVESVSWVRLRTPAQSRVLGLATDLGEGEREVIALGVEIADSLVLLDDRLARQRAQLLGLRLSGTLGVLLRARQSGYLSAIAPILDRLQALRFGSMPRRGNRC